MNPEGQQGGYILLPVMFTLMLVATVAFMMNHEAGMGARGISSELEAARARYVAEAGLQHALWQTKQQGCGPYTDLTNYAFGNDEYDTQLTHDLGSTTSYSALTDQDTWIRSDLPAVNNATDSKLHIRFEGGVVERPLYRYDLSSIPAQATILSAKAYFYVSKEHPEGPVDMHLVTADWSEADATWDSMGSSIDQAVLASIPAQPLAGVWVPVNLTGQVQAWVNGAPNYGLTLNSTSEGTHGDYASRESATESYIEVMVGNPATSPAKLKATSKTTGGGAATIKRDVVLTQSPVGFLQLQPGDSDGKDAWVSGDKIDWNYGGATFLRVRAGGGGHWHIFLEFDLSRLPQGARIQSARLEIYRRGNSQDSPGSIEAYPVSQSWEEGTSNGGTNPGVTFDFRDILLPWNTPGGDYDTTPVASFNVSTATDTWYELDVTPFVRQWVDGKPNLGLVMVAGDDNVLAEFASSEDADPTLRPKLSINYVCECGQVCLGPQGSGRIALIGDDFFPDPDDQLKIEIIESWGYQVDFYEDSWVFLIDWSNYDLAYVSETVISSAVNTQLTDLSIGVVNEEPLLYPDMAQGNGFSSKVDSSIEISDNSHYITAPFTLGSLPIYAGDMEILSLDTPLPSGTQVLADHGGDSVLTILEKGAINNWGNPSAGRRVTLPLGRHFASDFNWNYLNNNGRLLVQRALQWGTGNDPGASPQNLLFVAGESVASANELARIALIESWGYVVNLITDHDSQVNFDTAVAANNVAYVSQEVRQNELGSKLTGTTIGIVNEDKDFPDDFGFADGTFSLNNQTELDIVDNTHYITSSFPIGPLTFGSSQAITVISNTSTVAPDLQAPATVVGAFDVPAVSALESGATTWEDGTTTGRRVLLPWGSGTFDITGLNADGQTLTRRAIEWAAGADSGASMLIGHWMLDDGSGLTAIDSSGNGNDGTLTDSTGPVWTTGTLAGALDFDGSNDRVLVPDDPSLDITDTITLAAWVRPNKTGTQYIIRKALFDGTDGYELSLSSTGKVFFRLNQASNANTYRIDSTSSYPTDGSTWMHIAATYDGAVLRLYLDGVEEATLNATISIATNDTDLSIGAQVDGSRGIEGVIDDARLYAEALSASDIAALATKPLAPIAHWKLDETSGTNAVDSVGGHDGTVTGAVWSAGQIDGALAFDADNILVPHDDALALSKAFTLVAWVNSDVFGSSYQTILQKGRIGTNQDYWFGTWQRELVLGFFTGGAFREVYTTGLNLQTDTWYQLAATFDNANDEIRLYVNGVEVLNSTTPYEPPASGDDLVIGRSQLGEYWQGRIDDIRIYDNILSATQVADLYAEGGGVGGGSVDPPPEEGSCNGSFRDEFSVRSFGNNDGTLNWTGNWLEVGESDEAISGDIQIMNDQSNYQLRLKSKNNSLEREVDLSGASSAILSFDYRRQGLDNTNDYVLINISKDGGGYTEIGRINGSVKTDGSYLSFSQNIDSYISSNTKIQLQSSSKLGAADIIWFDNIQIQCGTL